MFDQKTLSTSVWKECLSTIILCSLVFLHASCTGNAASSPYFGTSDPPRGQILRYVTGSEPESLDPQVSTGQAEARIYMALFEGLVEYDPKTMDPIPAIALAWEGNDDSTEFVFHLRRDARWSDGEPLTARDFVYSIRRGLSPALASRSASFGYYIRHAKAYNEGGAFVRDPESGRFLSAADAGAEADGGTGRLVVAGDEKGREAEFKTNPRLKEILSGKELVPVRAEDVGVEAVDDYALRITLSQSMPFFVKLLPHQFFRAVPRRAIEKYGERWTKPGNIVTCGPFRLKTWEPYHEVVVERDPMYWDAKSVRLEEIRFYPTESNVTTMNLYKTGEVDAVGNHMVPVSWLDSIRPLRDYMDAPEAATEFFAINVNRAPMDDVRVRKAFSIAIDRDALASWKRTVKPLTGLIPEGIFPDYPQHRGEGFDAARAKRLLAEAGFRDAAGNYDPSKFPAGEVELLVNAQNSVKQLAEYLQAQWKQNLGIIVAIRSMETRAFLSARARLEYKGFVRSGYSADYMDPSNFLSLFYTAEGDSGSGWHDPMYSRMLDEANRTLDPRRRYELLGRAEAYLIEAQPFIPLWTPSTNFMKKPYVMGMYPNPGTLHPWKYIYIEHDRAKWDSESPRSKLRS